MIEKIYNQNYKSILKNIDYYSEKFLLDGILFFDNLVLNKELEWDIFCSIGDKIGFLPNSKTGPVPVLPFYSGNENHSTTFNRHKERVDENSILIEWHLENLHKDSPQVAAMWNMINFNCSSKCGRTGFANMKNIYSMFPSSIKTYLDNLEIILSFDTDLNGTIILNSSEKINQLLLIII